MYRLTPERTAAKEQSTRRIENQGRRSESLAINFSREVFFRMGANPLLRSISMPSILFNIAPEPW